MAVTAKIYGKFFLSLADKLVDLNSDTLKCLLATSAYVPAQDTHQFLSDVTNEVVGTGYTAGGQALTGVTTTYDAATNTFKLDANNPLWNSSTITARFAVFYDATPASDATRPLISYADFGEDIVSSVGTFTVELDPAGIVTITAA